MDNQEFKTTSPVPNDLEKPLKYLFLDAMKEVQAGKRITRVTWDNNNVYGLMKDGQLMLHLEEKGKDGSYFWQWIITDGDLFADDWIILETN